MTSVFADLSVSLEGFVAVRRRQVERVVLAVGARAALVVVKAQMATEERDGAGRGCESLPRLARLLEALVDPGPQLPDRRPRLPVRAALGNDHLDALVRVDADAHAAGAGRAPDGVFEVVHDRCRLRGAAVAHGGG